MICACREELSARDGSGELVDGLHKSALHQVVMFMFLRRRPRGRLDFSLRIILFRSGSLGDKSLAPYGL